MGDRCKLSSLNPMPLVGQLPARDRGHINHSSFFLYRQQVHSRNSFLAIRPLQGSSPVA